MALTFSNTAGAWFNRVGQAGAALLWARTNLREEGTLVTHIRTFTEQYNNITEAGDIQEEEEAVDGERSACDVFRTTDWGRLAAKIRADLEKTLKKQVWRDVPLHLRDETSTEALTEALLELRRQMVASSDSVKISTIGLTASSVTGTGNGAFVASNKRGDGLVQELAFVETGRLRCEYDSYRDGYTVNREWFYYRGAPKLDGLHPDWGEASYGSGAKTLIKVIDPTAFDPLGNLLTNSFETAAANVFPNWFAATGTAGADFASTTTAALLYFGSTAFKFIGGTAVNTAIEQTFNTSTTSGSGAGTLGRIYGSIAYAVILRLKAETGVPASGVITVSLTNSAGTTLNDDAGTANSFTCDLTTLSTSAWTNFSGFIRPPKNMASGAKLRIVVTTVIPAGTNVAMDGVAFAKATECYPGGPYVALFAGSTPFIVYDFFTLAATNTNGGASTARETMHRVLDAVLNLREKGILLPTASSPTVADSLIT